MRYWLSCQVPHSNRVPVRLQVPALGGLVFRMASSDTLRTTIRRFVAELRALSTSAPYVIRGSAATVHVDRGLPGDLNKECRKTGEQELLMRVLCFLPRLLPS